MTDINAKKMATKAKSRIIRPFCSTIVFSVDFRPYADRSGDRRSQETILINLGISCLSDSEMYTPGDGLLGLLNGSPHP